MRGIFTTLLLSALMISVQAQDDAASAVNMTLTDYLADTGTGIGCTDINGTLGASGSGQPTCAGIDNDDVWYVFTAQTQGAKFTASSAADVVLEVLDAVTMTTIGCINDAGAGGTEVLRVSDLTAGDEYYLRIHSVDGSGGTYTVCGQYYPASEVRVNWYPYPPTDIGLPGYRVNQTINRVFYTPYNDQITGTRWLFVNTDTNEEHEVTINGTSGIVNINAVGGICFGYNYDVFVEVRVDDFWCGYSVPREIIMEAVPTTEMELDYVGGYYDLNDNLKARFVGTGQNIEWRLTTNNGDVVFTEIALGNSSFVYFENLPCVRYNRIYQVETRVEYCGVWGPWSEPEVIFTNPLPYVNLRPQYCNTVQWPGITLLSEFLPIVDAYGWQLAPIETGDPSMTPTGPAIVQITPSVFLYVLPLGVTFNQTYRVGIKPFLGANDNCNDPQEGDYGFFCPVTFGDPNAIMSDPEMRTIASPFEEPSPIVSGEMIVYPVPASAGPIYLTTSHTELNGSAQLSVYDAMGRRVHNEQIQHIEDHQVLPIDISGDWSSGRYIVVLQAQNEVLKSNFLITK